MEGEGDRNLPICCWDMIISKVNNPDDRDSISLVCKEFLSITNLTQDSLTVVNPSIHVLTNLLQRFRHLKKIQLEGFSGDLSGAIDVISRSGLNLEELSLSCNVNLPDVCLRNLGSSMKNLKILCCSRSSLKDSDLVNIADFFPRLEEIDISDSYFPHIVDGKTVSVTDEGIEFLTAKLRRLRKVNISGNQCISDKSLVCLSLNCPFIQQIVAGYCMNITEHGISFLLHNSPLLKSLVLMAHFTMDSFGVENLSDFSKNLSSLRLSSLKISDEFLQSVANVRIPLTELSLTFCKGCYTFSGISSLLHSHRSLKSLTLLGVEFLTNEHIDYFCQFLSKLSSIQLHFCPLLSDSAFFMLSDRCTLLTRLEMGYSSLGTEDRNNEIPVKNFAILSLNLSSNQHLVNRNLERVLRICPNVQKLDLSKCFQGAEPLDVAEILDYCHTLECLQLNDCRHLKFSGKKAKNSKLQKLVAKYSDGMNDEVLEMIGKNSPGLKYLDLEDCENITEKGVKAVVESCKRLRFLNLSGCSNVDVEIVPYIVQHEPSLRKVVSPSCLYPEEEDQTCFLQQGCLVKRGFDYEEFI